MIAYRLPAWGFIALAYVAHFVKHDEPAAALALANAILFALWEVIAIIDKLAGTVNSASPDSTKEPEGSK